MKFGVVGNLSKETLGEAVLKLLGTGEKRFIEFVIHDEIAKLVNKETGKRVIQKKHTAPLDKIASECDILVAFGGDGTMLSAARLVGRAAVPIIGVNLGKLGFLAELSVEEVESFVDDILNNQHVIEDRMVIKVTAEDQEIGFFGVNDIVLDKGISSRVIDIETYVNNDYLMTYRADGLIVSTPTGSTGYSLATGGPIVVPKSDVLMISPICPHTLSARSVVVPDSSVIRVSLESRFQNVRITVDGQQEKIVTPPMNFFIQKADYTVKLVKRKDKSYYDVLRSKLMWGKDIRVTKVD
ncbi:MAG TPA: NAD(+)/NADH kinase [Bacteroidota bacterium]|nr:NAD(+)/NADH kinase [Bacteroidota bacterium]